MSPSGNVYEIFSFLYAKSTLKKLTLGDLNDLIFLRGKEYIDNNR